MSFASLPFVGLVAAGVILYYLVPKKLQWVVLLLASMVFYLAGGVKSAVWLVLVAAVTWLSCSALFKSPRTAGSSRSPSFVSFTPARLRFITAKPSSSSRLLML